MESINNFLRHVFKFDDDSKSDLLNIIQYSFIAIIPIVLLNKAMSKYIPEADEKKASLEISFEVVLQILVMFLGLFIVQRIITFFPTFSGVAYPEFHVIYIVLAVLMITISIQTKLGEKINIIVERVIDLWNGKEDKNVKKQNSKVFQQTSGEVNNTQINSAAFKQSLYADSTPISTLPSNTGYNNSPPVQQSQQSSPDFNKMYQQNSTPLINSNNPGEDTMQTQEPMAANSLLGSSSGFGSW